MKKITYALAMAVSVFASCTGSYNVQGSSSVSALDGSKLYLKAITNTELKNIASCDDVHGQCNFNGTLDTVRMVNLFMDDQSIMPMVLEEGEITIKIDNASQKVSGTPLNEKLYDFLDKHNRLDNQMNELAHKQSQMMPDGIDEDEINQKLSIEAAQIAKEEDKLVTSFIVDNFDNVLGPGVFMMITSGYQYPILTPQIEDIMSKATDKFKSNPYVSEYYKIASENEARMQGLEPDGTPTPTQAQPQETIDSISAGQQVNNSPFSQKVLTDSIKK